jgi:hypothetical protein
MRKRDDWGIGCGGRFDAAVDSLAKVERKPDFVVLRSYWNSTAHVLGGRTRQEEAERIGSYLGYTLDKLKDLGARRILVVGTQPDHQFTPACLVRASQRGLPESSCARSFAQIATREEDVMRSIQKAIEGKESVRLIHPTRAFCVQENCRFAVDSEPLYTDSAHLSQAGEAILFRTFAAEFSWAVIGNKAVNTNAPGYLTYTSSAKKSQRTSLE